VPCESSDGVMCRHDEAFVVHLLTRHDPASRRTCQGHLAATVTWAHEVATLKPAVGPAVGPWLVAVTPVADNIDQVCDSVPARQPHTGYRASTALTPGPPRRNAPGILAWTQRAFYRPGRPAMSPRRALCGLILWHAAILACLYAAMTLHLPLAPTPAAVDHALHDQQYPGAWDELILAIIDMILVLLSTFTAYLTIAAYWRTRPATPAMATGGGSSFRDRSPTR
jgi:hypothetical protein